MFLKFWQFSQFLTSFLSRLAPGWDLIESSGWKDYIFLNFRFISKVIKSGFDWRDHSAENKISKVDYTPFCARPQKSPFGPPMDHAGGECFAPYIYISEKCFATSKFSHFSQFFTPFSPRLWPGWTAIKTIGWMNHILLNFMLISENLNSDFTWRGRSAENETSKVGYT